jgi:hypothetical protein
MTDGACAVAQGDAIDGDSLGHDAAAAAVAGKADDAGQENNDCGGNNGDDKCSSTSPPPHRHHSSATLSAMPLLQPACCCWASRCPGLTSITASPRGQEVEGHQAGLQKMTVEKKNDLMRKLAELDAEDANDNESVPPSLTPV